MAFQKGRRRQGNVDNKKEAGTDRRSAQHSTQDVWWCIWLVGRWWFLGRRGNFVRRGVGAIKKDWKDLAGADKVNFVASGRIPVKRGR